MLTLTIILALYLEPVGSVLEEPWDYLCPIEMIDVIELDDLERKIRQQEIREFYRYLQEAAE